MKLNTASALGGAGTGALYGHQMAGLPGAAIGGIGGGLMGLFSGGDKKKKRTSSLDPKQEELYGQWIQALMGQGGPLADVFSQFNPQQLQELFQQTVANPSYQNFNENVIPSITGQFRGQNLQNSSYMGGALAKEGGRLQQNLDNQLAQLMYQGGRDQSTTRNNAIQNILGMSTFAYDKPQPTAIESLLGGLSSGVGQWLANKQSFPEPWRQNQFNAPMGIGG